MKKTFLLCLCLGFIFGCQRRMPMHSSLWEAGQGMQPQIPQDLQEKVIQIKTKFGTVERASQIIEGAEVDRSFLQMIKNRDQKAVYLQMSYVESPSKDVVKKINHFISKKSDFLVRVKRNFSELRTASYISPVKVMVSTQPRRPEVYYQFDVVSQDNTSAERWKISSSYRVFEKIPMHSCFDGQGMAFPNGPRLSQIEEVILPHLVGDGSLRSMKVNITTQSGKPAVSAQQAFFFKPDDPRFDQVQVFYYANKMIQQFKDRLGVELPFEIEFKTHIGFPEKKTVMFYYDHRVHLGQGDDTSYKDVLKDPTIVMHETAHAFVDALAGLSPGALNEAFADFFTASFLDHPHLGEVSFLMGSYTRTVDNQLTFNDKKGTTYGDSQIVSGTLWEIRENIGAVKAEALALKTLMRLGPQGEFEQFGKIIKKMTQQELMGEEKTKVLKILEQRHFPLQGEM